MLYYMASGFFRSIKFTKEFIQDREFPPIICGPNVINSVQLLTHVQLFVTPRLQHARLPCPAPTARACSNSCPSGRCCHPSISSCPLLLLPSILHSIRVFSNESNLRIKWPKYWCFRFSISPSSGYSGLISIRTDWSDLCAVQGILKSLLQHHSSKASILLCSAFFMVQLSHPYITTGKTIALTLWTFVSKVRSLYFNMLSKFVMEKAMAPHSSTLAWKIPWTEKLVAKSQTQRSDFTFTFHFHALEKEMATHSSVLAWRIPGMGEPAR